jgi:MPBQ/MSBQ methyltransferase
LSLDWLYTFDELTPYRVNTKQGKERLEAQIKNLPSLMSTARISLPRNPRILCLMAGSCIEGIAFAKVYDADVTCVDLQKSMLALGLKEAKRRKLNVHAIRGDIRELSKLVQGKFDLITILGSPLPHMGIFEFDQVIVEVTKVLAKKGAFLVDQSDLIFRILPQYRDAFISNLDPPVMNVHKSLSPRHGYFERLYFSRTRHDVHRTFLWAPWIIEYMLKKNGFREAEVKSYVDPYSMMQTFLHAAKSLAS